MEEQSSETSAREGATPVPTGSAKDADTLEETTPVPTGSANDADTLEEATPVPTGSAKEADTLEETTPVQTGSTEETPQQDDGPQKPVAFEIDWNQSGGQSSEVDTEGNGDDGATTGLTPSAMTGGEKSGSEQFRLEYNMGSREFAAEKCVARAEERRRKEQVDKLREECLPCIVNKFADMGPSEVGEIEFVTEDTKLTNAIVHIHNIFNTHDASKESYKWLAEPFKALAECDGIFFAFRKLLEILFQNNLTDEGFSESHTLFEPSTTYKITCFLLNAADHDVDIAKRISQEPGLLELFVWLLKQMKDRHKKGINRSADVVLNNSMNLLYNCSIFPENRQRLLEVGCLEACLPYLDSETTENQRFAFLSVAYLADEKQSEALRAKRDLIEGLVSDLSKAIPDPSHRYMGWAAVELARGLDSLARNDTNKKLIIDCGAIDALLLATHLEEGPDEQAVFAEAMQVLWTLSFDEAAKTVLRKQEEAMKLFDDIVSATPKHRCRKAAKGILWNLRDAETYHPTEDPGEVPHIMISYQWAAKPLVLAVRDYLRNAGYKIWVDVDHMEGSTIHAMAEAVEKSAVVLMCMSHGYKESQNCRSEAEYAYTRKKEMIPLVVETKYKPDGWLGFIKGAKMYYDITNKATFQEKMKQLLKALGSKGKLLEGVQPVPVPPRAVKEAGATGASAHVHEQLKDWDKQKVSEWMKRKGVERETSQDLSGSQLHFLHRMLHRAPEYYYSFVERNLHHINDFTEVITLTNALEEAPDGVPMPSGHF